MLITISGMVGSGKSTTAATVNELLTSAGLTTRQLRFRYLGLFGFARPHRPRPERDESGGERKLRAEGFELRRLTALVTAGYAVRIVAFRLSGIGGRTQCDILDRYFYDSLVHYQLQSRRESIYTRILRGLIPTPDLAILVVASDETICDRRRNYARQYVTTASRKYSELRALFPNLTPIRTDPGSATAEEIRSAVQALLTRVSDAGAALGRRP